MMDRLRPLASILASPYMSAFVPMLALFAFWAAGELALLIVALGMPLVFLFASALDDTQITSTTEVDPATALPQEDALLADLQDTLELCTEEQLVSALFLVRLEDFDAIIHRHGQNGADLVAERLAQRFRMALSPEDKLYWMGNASFAICSAPATPFDLETALQMAARLQSCAEEPISLGHEIVHSNCAIGFCLSARLPDRTAKAALTAAQTALSEALRHAPSSIRGFSAEMGRAAKQRSDLTREAAAALESGQITPFFQPQISTDTGLVTGFEALARWKHPKHGTLRPALFLPALDAAGLTARLSEVILHHALSAIKSWDAAGLVVPSVAVNFTAQDLRDPMLAERIRWDLDRFELAPERLTVEVLETIVAGSPEDAAARNLASLSKQGCRIDLDDFGTGHASITSINRFAIQRLKIDRSFIINVDKDKEQQRMVSAIQTMAERLGLETVAEGVETAGEHTRLAQLGCAHVQGYGIAHPMPLEDTKGWLHAHNASLAALPQIQSRRG